MRTGCALLFILSFAFARSQGYETALTVAQDGTGDYERIQDAIHATKAFPDVPIVIHIKKGIYKEKVHVFAWNTHLSLIGDTTGAVVISYNDHFRKINLGRNSTFHTYTLKVEANDFYAENLIIENTAGDVGQAVAVHVEGDRVAFRNCQFYGNQDTMYLGGERTRQYFQQCTISGTTDFIFGSATALFKDCHIVSQKASYITAASTPAGVPYGFVFMNCTLSAKGVSDGSVYLGRPWRGYAKTAFISCKMGAHIHPAGWKEWHPNEGICYAEYASEGSGGDTRNRANWSRILSEKEAAAYTIEKIFDNWTPKEQ